MNTVFLSGKYAKDVHMEESGKGYNLFVGDENVHLDARHTLSRQARQTSTDNVLTAIQGGHFVFDDVEHKRTINRELREFKYNNYSGFIQSQEFIDRFGNDQSLGRKQKTLMEFGELGIGGAFELYAGFDWSAFSPTLTTAVEIMRLICENGNKIRHAVLQKEVPVINMYDEHIMIAAQQTLDATRRHIGDRFVEMSRDFADVRKIELARTHVLKRLDARPSDDRLIKISKVLFFDYEDFYTPQALDTTAITSNLQGHLSQFDLYNIITEVATHTDQLANSSKNALDKMGSDMLFKINNASMLNDKRPARQTFGSPELAFFG